MNRRNYFTKDNLDQIVEESQGGQYERQLDPRDVRDLSTQDKVPILDSEYVKGSIIRSKLGGPLKGKEMDWHDKHIKNLREGDFPE